MESIEQLRELAEMAERDVDEVRSRATRFWSYVKVTSEGECWEWTRSKQRGYGQFYVSKGRHIRAHRAAWMLVHGHIPSGLIVCHSCDNPACCNPAHLWLGTDADNNRDRHQKGRTVFSKVPAEAKARGELHGSAKLTEEQVAAIFNDQRPSSQIAAEYGINFSNVCRIKRGQSWTHVTRALVASLIAQAEVP